MSYILDALRKADAQRERDASRGIHANDAPLGPTTTATAVAPRVWTWAAIGVAVAVIAGVGWYMTRPAAPGALVASAPAVSPVTPATTTAPMTPPAVTPPAAPATPPVAQAISPPPPAVPTQPPPRDPTNSSLPTMRGVPQTNLVPPQQQAESQRAALAREQSFARTAPGTPQGPQAQRLPPTQAQATTQPAPANAGGNAAAAPTAITGLPPDAPQVAITGGVYSPSPAQRMLIVNGQVFNEGSEVAPGVSIEKIEPRTAVLRWHGTRYTVAY